MAFSISSIKSVLSPEALAPKQNSLDSTSSFENVLKSAINNVEASSAQANAAVSNYISGGNQELHSMILATQNAELNLEMFMQVRNKVVSAYEEIMRMQV